MFCRYCGKEIPEDSRFCSSCGRHLIDGSPVQQAAVATNQKPSVREDKPLPDEPFERCPRCNHQHRWAVERCTACGFTAAVRPKGWPPPFHWERGLTHGLLGYLGVQGAMWVFGAGVFPTIEVSWPIAALYAAFWTVACALEIPDGPTWGALFGLVGLHWVAEQVIGPATSAMGALKLGLATTGFALLVMAVVGLIRGKLEFLRLHDRTEVSKLFTVAIIPFAASFLITGGGTAGQIEFGPDYQVSGGMASVTERRESFAHDEQMAWVAHLSRPAPSRVELAWIVVEDGAESLLYRVPLDLANSGYTVVWNKHPVPLLPSGEYRLRILSTDGPLAEGSFRIR